MHLLEDWKTMNRANQLNKAAALAWQEKQNPLFMTTEKIFYPFVQAQKVKHFNQKADNAYA